MTTISESIRSGVQVKNTSSYLESPMTLWLYSVAVTVWVASGLLWLFVFGAA